MPERKPVPYSAARLLPFAVFFIIALTCLFPAPAGAQGAPKTRWFHNPMQFAQQAVYSPDGKTLAIAARNGDWGVLELRDASTGQVLQSFMTTASYNVTAVAFSPDGKTLADGGISQDSSNTYYGVVELWSVSTGNLLQSIKTAASYSVNSVAFSPDGKTLAVGGDYQTSGFKFHGVVELWNVSAGKLLQSLNTTVAYVFSVAFSPNGKTLADGGDSTNDIVELWNVSTGKPLQSLKTAASVVNSVAFSPDGKILADGGDFKLSSNSNVGVLELWNVSTGKLLQSLKTVADPVNSVAFSLDGKTLLDGGREYVSSAAYQGVIEFWNVATGKLLQSLNKVNGITSVALSPDGKTLADTGYNETNGVLELWNVSTGKLLQSIATGAYAVYSLAFSPDGQTFADGGDYEASSNNYEGVLNLGNVSTGKLLRSFNTAASGASGGGIATVAYSPDGKTLADGGVSSAGVLELWSLSTGKLLQSLKTASSSGVSSLAFSPDSTILGAGGYYQDSNNNSYGVVELWNVATGKLLQSLPTAAGVVNSIAFSPDRKTVAVGGATASTGILELWSVTTGKLLQSLKTLATVGVSSLSFSPDGKILADGGYYTDSSSNNQGIVELWNVSTGKIFQSPKTMTNGTNGGTISSVAFSPDGKTLIDGGSTGQIPSSQGVLEFWDVVTGKALLYYDQFVGTPYTLAFSPTSEYIASGSGNGLLVMAVNPLYVPPTLSSLTLASSSITGGQSTTGRVFLSNPAPTSGATVSLTSSNPALVTVPAAVVVASVNTRNSFLVTTKKVTATTTVTLTAKWGTVTKRITLTLTP